jgi:hypothetical protein
MISYCTSNFLKKLPVFFSIFITLFVTLSCSTIDFGLQESGWDNEQAASVSEYNLSYRYKVMGIPVQGDKSIVESFFQHPDGDTSLLFLSFPRIGILQTRDNGKTFTPSFFKVSVLDTMFGYDEENGEERPASIYQDRVFVRFAVSEYDPDKIVCAAGPAIFISSDRGATWKTAKYFHDMENNPVRDLFITGPDSVIAFTPRRMLTTSDWGRRWRSSPVMVPGIPKLRGSYTCGLFDPSSDSLVISIQDSIETHAALSDATWSFFSREALSGPINSGVFHSGDFGKTWERLNGLPPLLLWQDDLSLLGGPLYPLHLYASDKKGFNPPADGKITVLNQDTRKFVEWLLDGEVESMEVIPLTGTRMVRFSPSEGIAGFELFAGVEQLWDAVQKFEHCDAIHWQDNWSSQKISGDFNYEYNLWHLFKRWTGMRTGSPVRYCRSEGGDIYRMRPDPGFLEKFIRNAIEGEIRLNTVHAFMKRIEDIEFLDPVKDPTGGFPVILERSSDSGISWEVIADPERMRVLLDPLGTKRSGFYWYKNVTSKKFRKLQLSFGFDKGVSYAVYPAGLYHGDGELLLHMNYFSLTDSFKDLYRIDIDE